MRFILLIFIVSWSKQIHNHFIQTPIIYSSTLTAYVTHRPLLSSQISIVCFNTFYDLFTYLKDIILNTSCKRYKAPNKK